MESLFKDIRYSVRTLLKNPGFTVITVLTLALGIGANTAVFSVINAVLLRPLPYPHAERMVYVWRMEQSDPEREYPLSPQTFANLQSRNQSFDSYCAFSNAILTLTSDGKPEALSGVLASADLWNVVGVTPAIGRAFTAEEDVAGRNRVALISDKLWKRRFDANPQVTGQELRLDGDPYTIIGVLPPAFDFPRSDVEVWTPLGLDLSKSSGGQYFLSTIARLKPNVTVEQSQEELQSLAAQLKEEFSSFGLNYGLKPEPLLKHLIGDIKRPLLILFGAVVLVLLIACINVANLVLGRATARWREIALRNALGASRWSLMRSLLVESVLLAVAGGGAGLLLAAYSIDGIIEINPAAIPNRKVTIDVFVIVFTFLMSFLTGVLFGLIPALQATKTDLHLTLRENSRGATGGKRLRLIRGALIVAEISLSLMLLVSAGLLVKSFGKLLGVNPGFKPENVATCAITLPAARYADERRQADFFRRTIQQAREIPGVESAGLATSLPFSNSRGRSSFRIDDRPAPPGATRPEADRHQVAPGYFTTMGIPLREGRDFTDADDMEHPGVVVINEATAKLYWPNEDPLGKRLTIGMGQEVKLYGRPVSREIIGVIGNVKHSESKADFAPEMYIPAYQVPAPGMTLIVRGQASPGGLIDGMRRAVESVDPEQPIRGAQLLEKAIARSVAPQRFVTTLFLLFASLALVLAIVGIYGVMSNSVTQRTQEIGIRIALGAQGGDVLRLILGQGLTLALMGVAIGVAASLVLTRVMSSLLYDVSATDTATFVVIAVCLTGVSLLACYLPSRRAMKVDPMVALRYE